MGINNCRGHLNFIRFVLELHDISMDEYMEKTLSKNDYDFWKSEKLTLPVAI